MIHIAIPVHEGQFNPHFGKSKSFRVFAVKRASGAVDNQFDLPIENGGACAAIAPALKRAGVSVVLVRGIGAGAVNALRQFGIEPVIGVPALEPAQLVADYLAGKLRSSGELCGHHHGHDACHAHGHSHEH